ncbi:pyruvyltransferase [Ruminococcus sp. YRD2003]|uniref:polysaccharide pyruvyl transferase family protein n=1 Tax=Ruminococcus sp. YRD2003 TaxID=1452313 RepID=UPI0008B5EFA9|nr:pyruvyltransferase [Ruminococcus flavefaciens]
MLSRLIKEASSIISADSIMLDYPRYRAHENKVNLHYYHAERQEGGSKDSCNIGDYLSEVIVRAMLERKGFSLDDKISGKRHLYAIGSILQMGYQNATVWGSGFAFEPNGFRALPHKPPFRRLDVRCVRGPYTRRTLLRMGHSCPNIYGDPAVLLPLFYQPLSKEKKFDYLVIPHYSMFEKAREVVDSEQLVSMNTKDYCSLVDKIVSAKKVISSSLHGIILAEAYGVPAIYYEDRPERFRYKYEDWYASTGRGIHVETDLQKAITMEVANVPDLARMKNQLVESFPYDLWM